MASTPIIDAHAHLGSESSVDHAVAAMDAAGVAQAIVMACLRDPVPPGTRVVKRAVSALLQGRATHALGRAVYAELPRLARHVLGDARLRVPAAPDNDAVARALALHPRRLRGLYFVNPPAQPDARVQVAELDRYVAQHGFVGAKAHLWWHRYRLVRGLYPVAAHCAARRMPLLVHLGGTDETSDIDTLWERLPDLPIILAHGGVPLFGRIWERARRARHVFVDLAGPYVTPALMRAALRWLGPERLVFGSDAPSGLGPAAGQSYGPLLRAVTDLPLRSSEVDLVLGGNVARVLDGIRA